MQALNKSDVSIRLEFIAVLDLVKNRVQLLSDRIEAAIVSTKESDRYFAFFLDEKKRSNKIWMKSIKRQLTITLKQKHLHRQLYHQKMK